MKNISENYHLPCISPLYDTWRVKMDAGFWSLEFPPIDLTNTSIKERNQWYANTFKHTVEAFSNLLRMYKVSLRPINNAVTKVKGMSFQWQPKESYEEHISNIIHSVEEYPADIDEITIEMDLFVYVKTPESYPQPVRVWVREFGDSIEIGQLSISISTDGEDPYAYFAVNHTLFCGYSYRTDEGWDNSELARLNQPLLTEALKTWEQKSGIEIDFEGLPDIYEYGFLPHIEWDK